MNRFPSPSADQVTLANWRTAPFSRWAFHHVREIVPSADIANDPADVMPLPEAPQALELDEFLAATDTDAFVVLHRDGWCSSATPTG
jgi:hypothetical protein